MILVAQEAEKGSPHENMDVIKSHTTHDWIFGSRLPQNSSFCASQLKRSRNHIKHLTNPTTLQPPKLKTNSNQLTEQLQKIQPQMLPTQGGWTAASIKLDPNSPQVESTSPRVAKIFGQKSGCLTDQTALLFKGLFLDGLEKFWRYTHTHMGKNILLQPQITFENSKWSFKSFLNLVFLGSSSVFHSDLSLICFF